MHVASTRFLNEFSTGDASSFPQEPYNFQQHLLFHFFVNKRNHTLHLIFNVAYKISYIHEVFAFKFTDNLEG